MIRIRNHKRILVIEHRLCLLECDAVFCGIGAGKALNLSIEPQFCIFSFSKGQNE